MVGKSDSTIYNQETITGCKPGGAEEVVFPFPSTVAGVLCPSITASQSCQLSKALSALSAQWECCPDPSSGGKEAACGCCAANTLCNTGVQAHTGQC